MSVEAGLFCSGGGGFEVFKVFKVIKVIKVFRGGGDFCFLLMLDFFYEEGKLFYEEFCEEWKGE